MGFYDILDQVLVRLQRHGRVSYRALKKQFGLDDGDIEDLKAEILYVYPSMVEDAGKGLIWTATPTACGLNARHVLDPESRFHALLPSVLAILRQEGRVTYRTLKYVFGLDQTVLEELREELTLRRVAIDEAGKVLVWTGKAPPTGPAAHPQDTIDTAQAQLQATPTLPPLISESQTPSNRSATPAEIATIDPSQDELTATPESTHTTPEAERRQLTVMFCDLADSTKLSQQLDPEDLREVVCAYQATAAEVIHQYEGHIAQYLGDGLLIYFGWPRAHEDDAQRSLRAGLEIVEAVTRNLNPRLEQEKGVQLTVRLGIHTGSVVVGEMGGGGRHENLATGEAVNIAARLEGLAPPNAVVMSSVTARLVEGSFALEELGPQMLKGVAESMPVFRVLGPMEAHEDETTAVGVPFLVGRDEEVGLLLRRWEQSKEGLGQVALISGEAGIGKSSLVTTLRHHVVQTGYTRLTFRCSPYHTNSALYPVIEHVQRVLHFQLDDTPATQLDKLEHVLNDYSRPLDEMVPLYADLLSVPLPEGRYVALNLTPQQQRQQTQDALVGWLLEEAERHPTLAMWEDLHWADPSTLEMLGLMLEQSPTVPMLSVLTFRPEFESPWPTRSHMTPITLNRLERPQVEALIRHLAQGKALPSEVIEHIVAKTDGVPLYVEELTKMLLESDLLREGEDQYTLTGPLTTVSIPDTLQDSLMARLDQLNQAKEVAQLGAVLGREFTYETLQAISPQGEEALQAGLAQLVQAELLYQRGRPPRARYIFKHALIQDAAYQSLLRSTRQQVHQRIVGLLEERFPELVEIQPELVARHCTEAGCHEQAVEYWQRAGQRSHQRSAYPEAVACFDHALNALLALPECRDTIGQAFDLYLQLRNALFPLRLFDRLLDVLREAETRARALDDGYRLALTTIYLGHYYCIAGEPTQAVIFGQRVVDIAGELGHADLQVVANSYLGQFSHCLGDYRQAKHSLTKAMMSVKDDMRHEFFGMGLLPAVHSRVWLAWTLAEMGVFREAITNGEEGLHVAETVEHPYSLTHACFGLGLAYLRQGAFPQAIPVLERGHAIAESYAPVASPVNEAHLGYALALSGRTSEAIPLLEDAVEQAITTRVLFYHSLWVAWLSETYLLDGDLERAHKLALQALELSRNRKEQGHQAWALRLCGEIFRQGHAPNVEQAEAHYQQALALANELGMRPLQAHCHHGLGTLYCQTRQSEQAQAELSTAIDLYRDMEMTFWLPEAESALAQVT